MRKSDVQQHRDGYGPRNPAVNVKVQGGHYNGAFERALRLVREHENAPEAFTLEWIDAHLSDDDRDAFWNGALADGWEQIRASWAENYLCKRYGARIYSEGRSEGWAVAHGLPDLECWDAVILGQWRRFERECETIAADTFYRYLWSIYANVFEPIWDEAQERATRATLRDHAGL